MIYGKGICVLEIFGGLGYSSDNAALHGQERRRQNDKRQVTVCGHW